MSNGNALLERDHRQVRSTELLHGRQSCDLLALGPVATVMAYDLAKSGRKAVDIGHLDLEYEWFLRGEGVRVPIPHKYVNEIDGGENVEDIHDEKYKSEIKIKVK